MCKLLNRFLPTLYLSICTWKMNSSPDSTNNLPIHPFHMDFRSVFFKNSSAYVACDMLSVAESSLFLLVMVCVVAVEIRGCRSGIARAPTLATLGAASGGTAECASRRGARVGRSSEQDRTAGPCAPARWTTYNVSWPCGGYSCSRETRHERCRKQYGRQ